MTKGFEIKISNKNTHLFIDNKKTNQVTFTIGKFNGKPVEVSQLEDVNSVPLDEKQFIQFVEHLAFIAYEMDEKNKKKDSTKIEYNTNQTKGKKK